LPPQSGYKKVSASINATQSPWNKMLVKDELMISLSVNMGEAAVLYTAFKLGVFHPGVLTKY
jgi:hypothetical protein